MQKCQRRRSRSCFHSADTAPCAHASLICVCADQWAPSVNEGMRGLSRSFLAVEREWRQDGEIQDEVPEEDRWTSALMRILALIQMGIDYCCRHVRRYLTFNSRRVRVRACVRLLNLSLYEESVIRLLLDLTDFGYFCLHPCVFTSTPPTPMQLCEV